MHNKDKSINWLKIEATVIDIIVAFIIVILIISTINVLFGKQIKSAINILDMFAIDTQNVEIMEIKFDEEKQQMINYPSYGSRYGNIKIETLNINLPLYYGDKMSILKNGVGQSSGAYFPGEGGSIICMAHNTKAFLYNLPNIVIGSQIEVQTTYGLFKYQVYQTKIVNMYHPEELPIQDEEEILMLYTCYPVTGLGHKKDRFVVYAKRI